MVVTSPISISEALERVSAIDLGMVRLKLADPEEGKGWAEDHLDAVEREYRRFLALHLTHPDAEIVPCGDVDAMWHYHILDTEAYGEDCDKVFGRFLHHFPYFGMRGDDDAQALVDAYEWTLATYREVFGEPVAPRVWAGKKSCRTKCKPVKCK